MNRQFAQRLIELIVAGELLSVGPMLADDVVWHLPPFAKRAPIHGRDAVLTFLRESAAAYYEPGTLSLEPHLVLADSDGASVLGTLRGRTVHGRDYENLYNFAFRVAGGRVSEAWELLDTAHLRTQMR